MARFRPAATETLAEGTPAIGIPGFVPWQNKMPNYFFATITLKVGALHPACAQSHASLCLLWSEPLLTAVCRCNAAVRSCIASCCAPG